MDHLCIFDPLEKIVRLIRCPHKISQEINIIITILWTRKLKLWDMRGRRKGPRAYQWLSGDRESDKSAVKSKCVLLQHALFLISPVCYTHTLDLPLPWVHKNSLVLYYLVGLLIYFHAKSLIRYKVWQARIMSFLSLILSLAQMLYTVGAT